jgi:hypothetical protein
MKGYLRFSIFIFSVLPNLAKYSFEWSALEQHYKIEEKNIVLKVPLRKNHVYEIQGQEPIHQKYKANESMSRHNPKKKNKSKQSTKNKEKKTLCK